eukprot:TRINITY_DN7773_c0_g1_i1.p1 TRINITY_DN7773_c0_g1~~TRINITY_DN7773_c0_g1_i1.p1  ORF type:complete len:363 (-),score=29.94 TRINITY_DN7773_c0_g1_i1:940-2028(-)
MAAVSMQNRIVAGIRTSPCSASSGPSMTDSAERVVQERLAFLAGRGFDSSRISSRSVAAPATGAPASCAHGRLRNLATANAARGSPAGPVSHGSTSSLPHEVEGMSAAAMLRRPRNAAVRNYFDSGDYEVTRRRPGVAVRPAPAAFASTPGLSPAPPAAVPAAGIPLSAGGTPPLGSSAVRMPATATPTATCSATSAGPTSLGPEVQRGGRTLRQETQRSEAVHSSHLGVGTCPPAVPSQAGSVPVGTVHAGSVPSQGRRLDGRDQTMTPSQGAVSGAPVAPAPVASGLVDMSGLVDTHAAAGAPNGASASAAVPEGGPAHGREERLEGRREGGLAVDAKAEAVAPAPPVPSRASGAVDDST